MNPEYRDPTLQPDSLETPPPTAHQPKRGRKCIMRGRGKGEGVASGYEKRSRRGRSVFQKSSFPFSDEPGNSLPPNGLMRAPFLFHPLFRRSCGSSSSLLARSIPMLLRRHWGETPNDRRAYVQGLRKGGRLSSTEPKACVDFWLLPYRKGICSDHV